MVLPVSPTISWVVLFLIIIFALPATALAQTPGDPYGLNITASEGQVPTGKNIPTLVGTIINTGLALIGLIFLILILYAGVLWMIARGDEAKVRESKALLVNGVIGLAIILAAYALVNFIFSQLVQKLPQ